MDKKPEDKPKAPASPAGAPPKKKKKKLDRFAPICIGILIVLMGLTFLQSLFGNRPNKVSSISESVTTSPSTETNPAETQTHSYALQSIDENELKTLATYFREHYYGFFSAITISPSPLIGVPSLSMLMPRRQKSLRKLRSLT